VTVEGVFVAGGTKVRGTILATQRRCSSGRIGFTGRLS
jgi:hypothetical protein